jgi:superfamily II RNA helicase
MVLNLLSTRSLEDCEHFLARSFLRFQTAGNVEETIAEAQRLDSEAEALLRKLEGGGDEELVKRFEAAKVRQFDSVVTSLYCLWFLGRFWFTSWRFIHGWQI